jgi:hypothetical protein
LIYGLGRIGMMKPKSGAKKYLYEVNDHLGNVRAVVGDPTTDVTTATYETANANTEQHQFVRYDNAKRIQSYLFDRTNGNATGFAERLNGTTNEKYGLASSLSVMPGDTIKAEVYAKLWWMELTTRHWLVLRVVGEKDHQQESTGESGFMRLPFYRNDNPQPRQHHCTEGIPQLRHLRQELRSDLEGIATQQFTNLEALLVEAKDRKYQVWERNSLSIALWSGKVFAQKLEYIHNNPVKAGLCACAEDYKYSARGSMR